MQGLWRHWYWRLRRVFKLMRIQVLEQLSRWEEVSIHLITFEGKGVPNQQDDNQNNDSNFLQDVSKYAGHGFKGNFISQIYIKIQYIWSWYRFVNPSERLGYNQRWNGLLTDHWVSVSVHIAFKFKCFQHFKIQKLKRVIHARRKWRLVFDNWWRCYYSNIHWKGARP